jgi:NADPH-dependent glutamate synthase beta subunit-like oxidoreductase
MLHYHAPNKKDKKSKPTIKLEESEAQYYRFMQTFAKSLYVGFNISLNYTKQYDLRTQCNNYYDLINEGKLEEAAEYLSETLTLINILHSVKN